MSTEKKVLFLLLTLIILIVSCVITHVDDFKVEENAVVNTKVESNSPPIITAIIEKAKSFISPIEEDIIQKEVIHDDISVDEKTKENISLTKVEVNNDTEEENKKELVEKVSSSDSEQIVEDNIIEEEKVEVPAEPLITTDERYNRTGDEKNIEDLSKDAQLLQIKMNELVKNRPIIFKRGSNKIRKSSNKTIRSVVEALKELPNIKIEVAGHTDAIGAAKLNKSISEQRAISVKKRLVYYGLEANRINARGYGEDIPLVKNSKNGYSKINRRVEFNIVEE